MNDGTLSYLYNKVRFVIYVSYILSGVTVFK